MFKFLKEKLSKWKSKVEKEVVDSPIEDTKEVVDVTIDSSEIKGKDSESEIIEHEKPIIKESTIESVEEKPQEISKQESTREKGIYTKIKEKFLKEPITPEEIKKDENEIKKQIKDEFEDIDEREPKEVEILKEKEISKAKPERKSFLKTVSEKINTIEINEKDFDRYSEDLEEILLENNVALEVIDKIIENLKKDLVGKRILKKEFDNEFSDAMQDSIRKILIDPIDVLEKITSKSEKPYVILFVGINGSGKTTTVAKIANLLKKNNLSCVIAAGDTFRAASIEQLRTHGEKLQVKVISQEYGSDPSAVGFDSIAYAKKNKIDVVLIDTAGRMHTSTNLLKEMEKINRVTKPDLKIFISEATTGNDATEQVKKFNDSIEIDGIILSKSDVDDKGGTALSVGYVSGKPVLFLGTGQSYDDIESFDKEKFIEKLEL
jgi:fused signal recognition particle receptor